MKTDKKKLSVGFFLAGFMILLKSTKIIAVLKLLKFTKPLVTVISLLISAIFYGFWLGPWFAIGFLAMLFIHEMGHIIALRIKGMETSGPVFIPFLGAAIFVPKFENRDTEAFVGFGGPLLGTIAALVCFGLFFATGQDSEILLLVSCVGVFLNLFNLIPISPLDGGRITQVVGGWFKYVGLALLLVFTIMIQQPQILMIWILVLSDFKALALWLKPSIASILAVSMALLMIFGFSGQPWLVDVIDCLVVSLFVLMYWCIDADEQKIQRRKSESGAIQQEVQELPYPALRIRMMWLCCYLVLTAIAAVGIFIQAGYLPALVHTHSEELTKPADQDR